MWFEVWHYGPWVEVHEKEGFGEGKGDLVTHLCSQGLKELKASYHSSLGGGDSSGSFEESP